MTASYICPSCRRELQRGISRRRTVQWLSKATFISLSDIVPPTKEQETSSDKPKPPKPQRTELDTSPPDPPTAKSSAAILEELFGSRISQPSSGRYSRYAQGQKVPEAGKVEQKEGVRSVQASLPAVSERTTPQPISRTFSYPLRQVREQQSPDDKISKRHTTSENNVVADTPGAALYKTLEDPARDVKDAWAQFKRDFTRDGKFNPALQHLAVRDKTYVLSGHIFDRLLRKAIAQWKPEDDTLPPPADVVELFQTCHLMKNEYYCNAIVELLVKVVQKDSNRHSQYKKEIQLLRLWAQLFKGHGNESRGPVNDAQPSTEGSIDWSGLPEPSRLLIKVRIGKDGRNFSYRLFRAFTGMLGSQRHTLAGAAILTLDYFTERYCQSSSIQNDAVSYEPLLRVIAHLLYVAEDLDEALGMARTLLEQAQVSEKHTKAVIDRLKDAPRRAAISIGTDSLLPLGGSTVGLALEQQERLEKHFQTRIGRQVESKNRSVMDQLWEQVKLAYSSPGRAGGRTISFIPPKLYSAFLFAYRELKANEKQDEVWNHMVANYITPSTDQWGIIISARARNLESMEMLWNQMLAAGVLPDKQIWTSRISAVIQYGKPQAGMQLLHGWEEAWFTEVRKEFGKNIPDVATLGDTPSVPKPDSDSLNIVITAFAQRRQTVSHRHRNPLDSLSDVFAWARRLGIKPNGWTYNNLFYMCLRDNNLDEAMRVLVRMEDNNIQPDAYTCTSLIAYLFKHSSRSESPLSTAEQSQTIISTLEALEKRGLEPNETLFSGMINGLLKTHDNLPAAQMLLRIMLDRGMKVPAPIWTTFVQYYFQQGDRQGGPGVPDFAALSALWRLMLQQKHGALTDSIFYDRMIEGFARYNDVNSARYFLDRMAKERHRPGWPALTAMVRAYVQNHMLEQAREIALDVAKGEGMVKEGVRFRRGFGTMDRDMFWAVLEDAGIKVDVGNWHGKALSEVEEPEVQQVVKPIGDAQSPFDIM